MSGRLPFTASEAAQHAAVLSAPWNELGEARLELARCEGDDEYLFELAAWVVVREVELAAPDARAARRLAKRLARAADGLVVSGESEDGGRSDR